MTATKAWLPCFSRGTAALEVREYHGDGKDVSTRGGRTATANPGDYLVRIAGSPDVVAVLDPKSFREIFRIEYPELEL